MNNVKTSSRRDFLRAGALSGAALLLSPLLFSKKAQSQDSEPLFLIHCVFPGGWDQLLALDPRDNQQFNNPGAALYTAYDQLAENDSILQELLASNPSGMITPADSNINFGPATGRLAEGQLFQDLCVLRGINMGTLTHEVGARYFLTGKFPQGLAANGSALATQFVAQSGDLSTIPNLVVGGETYNAGLAHFATGLQIRSSADLQTVLTPLGAQLPEDINAAIESYLSGTESNCESQQYNGEGLISQYLSSREKAKTMTASELGALFAFSTDSTDPGIQALNAAFNISSNANEARAQYEGAAGQAMIAAQALTLNLCQAVSIPLSPSIDHHETDYLTDHIPSLREGFNALADLITYLKSTQHATSGKALWDHCVLMCTSDFARTPNLNSRDGRDHHLASSCLLAGRGIQGNQVIGATDDVAMNAQPIDLQTGQVTSGDGGWTMRPSDVHATLLKAMDLDSSHLDNQDPQIIEAALL